MVKIGKFIPNLLGFIWLIAYGLSLILRQHQIDALIVAICFFIWAEVQKE